MRDSHLKALRSKHETLEKNINRELLHPARNDALIGKIKKEKLHLKEEIERVQQAGEQNN